MELVCEPMLSLSQPSPQVTIIASTTQDNLSPPFLLIQIDILCENLLVTDDSLRDTGRASGGVGDKEN